MILLTVDEVIELHTKLIRKTGGSDGLRCGSTHMKDNANGLFHFLKQTILSFIRCAFTRLELLYNRERSEPQ